MVSAARFTTLATSAAINCIFLNNGATGGNGGIGGNGGNGTAVSGGNGGNGGSGGTAFGGAIYNLGTLTLSNCTAWRATGRSPAMAGWRGTNGTGGSAFAGSGKASGGTAAGAGLYNQGTAIILGFKFDFNFCEGGNSQVAGGTSGGNGN